MKKTLMFFWCILTLIHFGGCSNPPESNSKTPKQQAKNLIVGTWEGIIDGDKLVWTVLSNGNEYYDWYHSTGIQHGAGKWSVEDDILYEQFEQSKTVCKLEFETSDHLILTVLDNGNAEYRGQKRDYYRQKAENKVGSVSQPIQSKNVSKQTNGLNSTHNNEETNSIIGIWKNHEVTEKYGIKSSMTIIWEFKSNNKSILRVRNENGYKNGNISTWKMIGTTLQTTTDVSKPPTNPIFSTSPFHPTFAARYKPRQRYGKSDKEAPDGAGNGKIDRAMGLRGREPFGLLPSGGDFPLGVPVLGGPFAPPCLPGGGGGGGIGFHGNSCGNPRRRGRGWEGMASDKAPRWHRG